MMLMSIILGVIWISMSKATETVGAIVGIFAQPSSSQVKPCSGNCEYIAASYVKWIESAGGRVIPIPYNASTDLLDLLFDGINALLLPGGSNVISQAARYMLHRAVKANENEGDYFPVWATCMGFEWMMVALSDEEDFRLDVGYDAWNISLPLNFTDEAFESRLFASTSPNLLKKAAVEPLAMNNHHYGVSPQHLLQTPALSKMFQILSTNEDRVGRTFVSTVEGKKCPFYGSQWHPEKNVYEWGKTVDGLPYEGINHSPAAQELTTYLSHFFLNEARRNEHRFEDPEVESKLLIYNDSPVYSGPEFVQSFYFISGR